MAKPALRHLPQNDPRASQPWLQYAEYCARLLDAWDVGEELTIDQLVERTGCTTEEVVFGIDGLLKWGQIEQAFGARYVKKWGTQRMEYTNVGINHKPTYLCDCFYAYNHQTSSGEIPVKGEGLFSKMWRRLKGGLR